jgi:hypothetical protein
MYPTDAVDFDFDSFRSRHAPRFAACSVPTANVSRSIVRSPRPAHLCRRSPAPPTSGCPPRRSSARRSRGTPGRSTPTSPTSAGRNRFEAGPRWCRRHGQSWRSQARRASQIASTPCAVATVRYGGSTPSSRARGPSSHHTRTSSAAPLGGSGRSCPSAGDGVADTAGFRSGDAQARQVVTGGPRSSGSGPSDPAVRRPAEEGPDQPADLLGRSQPELVPDEPPVDLVLPQRLGGVALGEVRLDDPPV